MLNIQNYMPEIVLLITILTCSFFLTKRALNNRTIRTLNILFVIGVIACASAIILEATMQQQLLIKNIFKFYFLFATTYYVFTYSTKFHALERLCLLTTCLSLFTIVSTTDIFVLLSAFALCIASTYGFALTRERPSKDTATTTSLLLVIAILYGQHPFMVGMVLLSSTIVLYLRTTSKDLEAFFITMLVPANIYILLRELLIAQNAVKIENSLIAVGIILMLAPTILLFSEANRTKTMAKFATFYIGTIIFLMGSGTIDIKTTSIMMLLSLVFIYSPTANPLTIIGLAMLPPATAFITRLPLFLAPFKSIEIAQIIAVSVASLAMSIFAAKELYSFHTTKEKSFIPFPIPFKIISIAVVIISVIYFNYINQTLGYAVRALGR
jgi:hypothetical protein